MPAAVGAGLDAEGLQGVAEVDAPADHLLRGPGAYAERVLPLGCDEHDIGSGGQQRAASRCLEAAAYGGGHYHVSDAVELGASHAFHAGDALGHYHRRLHEFKGLVYVDPRLVHDIGEVPEQTGRGELEVSAVGEHGSEKGESAFAVQFETGRPDYLKDDLGAGNHGVVAEQGDALPLAGGAVVVDDERLGHKRYLRGRQLFGGRCVHRDDLIVVREVSLLDYGDAHLVDDHLGHALDPTWRKDVAVAETPGQDICGSHRIEVRVPVDEYEFPAFLQDLSCLFV